MDTKSIFYWVEHWFLRSLAFKFLMKNEWTFQILTYSSLKLVPSMKSSLPFKATRKAYDIFAKLLLLLSPNTCFHSFTEKSLKLHLQMVCALPPILP